MTVDHQEHLTASVEEGSDSVAHAMLSVATWLAIDSHHRRFCLSQASHEVWRRKRSSVKDGSDPVSVPGYADQCQLSGSE